MRTPRSRLIVGLIAISQVALACGGESYDRSTWSQTFTQVYGISHESSGCILDGVEAAGLQERFSSSRVEIDFELERIIERCDLPLIDRAKLGVGP